MEGLSVERYTTIAEGSNPADSAPPECSAVKTTVVRTAKSGTTSETSARQNPSSVRSGGATAAAIAASVHLRATTAVSPSSQK